MMVMVMMIESINGVVLITVEGECSYTIYGNGDSTGTSRSTVTVETRKIIITIIL